MSRLLTGDDDFRDLSREAGNRSHLTSRRRWADGYRFGRLQAKRDFRSSRALRHVNGCLKTMIEAIANSKLRRMERELKFRGVRFDAHRAYWLEPKSGSTERSQ